MTTATSSVTPLGASPFSAPTNGLVNETQDRFMKLLVTQLRNQDPLNPMDNAQVTSQIAQLSTVNGINQLNNTLLSLAGQIDVGQSMQAANLIGKGVLVPGEKISVGSDPDDPQKRVTTPCGVDIVSPARQVVVSVMDASGKVVRKFELGPQEAGVHSLEWNGLDESGAPVVEGKYTIKVEATDNEGKSIPATALHYGKVESVAYTSEGLRLEMGLAGSASLLDIRKIM